MSLKPLREQVVVVMGASSGIGREAALRFAGRGAKVVVSARGEPGLRSLVEEIREGGGEAAAVVADAAEFEQVESVADRAAEEYGRLDTWVHVAGVGLFAAFEDTTPEEFRRVIDVNLMGQVHGAMAALPHIKREGRGALVHISSMGAKRSVPLQSAYCASKHGMEGFLEALRVELRHEGLPIEVTSIQPATTNTPFFDKARTKLGVKPVPASDLRSRDRRRCHPPRRRAPGARHRGRGCREGPDLGPAPLAPAGRRPDAEGRLRGPLHGRTQDR